MDTESSASEEMGEPAAQLLRDSGAGKLRDEKSMVDDLKSSFEVNENSQNSN